MTTLLLMTDGRRDCFLRTWRSLQQDLIGTIDRVFVHDDSGDLDYRQWLLQFTEEVFSTGQRSGFAGAMVSAWSQINDDYIIHWEDDFILNRRVYVDEMQDILDRNKGLSQIALKRQPWNAQEIAAGDLVLVNPDAYEQKDGFYRHRKFFTTNPSMYTMETVTFGWPNEEFSEGKFAFRLWQNGLYSAFLGNMLDAPTVLHIGTERIGHGY